MMFFDEYEAWLHEYIDRHLTLGVSNLFTLTESGGTNDDFKRIVDYVWWFINTSDKKWYYNEGLKCHVYISPTIYFRDELFLSDIRIELCLYESESKHFYDGIFYKNGCTYDIDDDKMSNTYIVVSQSIKTDELIIDKYNFYMTMYHELQHAYREYNMLKSIEKARLEDEEKAQRLQNTKQKGESTYMRGQGFFGSKFKKSFANTVSDMLYYSNVNEINSHMNEMIPYLEGHEEINLVNYKQYLNDIPGYFIIDRLKKHVELFNSPNLDTDTRARIGKIISDEIYDGRYNGLKCYYRMLTSLNKAVLYSEKQFYKILYYTLDRLNRRGSEGYIQEVKERRRNETLYKFKLEDLFDVQGADT